MRGLPTRACAALALALMLVVPASARDEGAPFVVVCPVSGDITDGLAVLVRRAAEREAAGAVALVLQIDTFGGRVDSAIAITESVGRAKCPVIAHVTGRGAISAGALIAYSCDKIIMAPGANIGASTPFDPTAQASDQVTEKSMSFLRAKYRALGELNGHSPLLGEAMVDPGIELRGVKNADGSWVFQKTADGGMESIPAAQDQPAPPHPVDVVFDTIGISGEPGAEQVRDAVKTAMGGAPPVPGRSASPGGAETASAPAAPAPGGVVMVSPAGKLLTLTTGEALEYGLAAAQAATLDEALAAAGIGGLPLTPVKMRWDEALFAFLTLPLISGLLLMVGVGGIYLEMKTPGIGWAGAVGAACLAVFFGSRLVIGMADWADIALVAAGIGLVAAEIFVFPGFGVPGVAGILCIFAGFYLALTRVTVPRYSWDYTRLTDAGLTLLTSSFALTLLVFLTWKLLPRTPLGRGLIQSHAQLAGAGYTVQTDSDAAAVLGRRGTAASMLRPAGRGRFDGGLMDVMTEGGFIEEGRVIEVIRAEGNRYVVREVEEDNG